MTLGVGVIFEPVVCSQGGIPINKVHIEYWKEQSSRADAEIERLRAALKAARPYVWNGDSPGGCDGTGTNCDHCAVIRTIDRALNQQSTK